MGEPAGEFYRVSTTGQDEANQEPEVQAWSQSHGYNVVKTYTLHGKSASKGEQQQALNEVLEDFRNGIIKVLVVWKDDRIERRGILHMAPFIRDVIDAGGRVEFVTQPALNDLSTMGGRISLTINSEIAREETQKKKDRIRIARERIRQNGGIMYGDTPWGYEVTGEEYNKRYTPTDEGRKYIPQIFQMATGTPQEPGKSLAQVAEWMAAETGRAWWPATIRKMLRNPVYMGHSVGRDGQVLTQCEPLVDAAVFAAAGRAMETRGKRGPIKPENKAVLTGILFCPNCGDSTSPMYRVNAGNKRKDGTKVDHFYYRCSGRGSSRKGCGNMVSLPEADALFSREISSMETHIYDYKFIPGHDHSAEIEEVKFQIRHLDLDATDYEERYEELRARLAELRTLPTVPDQTEEIDTGETWASRWNTMDEHERGTWLRSSGIKVYASKGMPSKLPPFFQPGVIAWMQSPAPVGEPTGQAAAPPWRAEDVQFIPASDMPPIVPRDDVPRFFFALSGDLHVIAWLGKPAELGKTLARA